MNTVHKRSQGQRYTKHRQHLYDATQRTPPTIPTTNLTCHGQDGIEAEGRAFLESFVRIICRVEEWDEEMATREESGNEKKHRTCASASAGKQWKVCTDIW